MTLSDRDVTVRVPDSFMVCAMTQPTYVLVLAIEKTAIRFDPPDMTPADEHGWHAVAEIMCRRLRSVFGRRTFARLPIGCYRSLRREGGVHWMMLTLTARDLATLGMTLRVGAA